MSCGQFLGIVTQASKAKDEAASLRGELRLARSEQADRFILSFFLGFCPLISVRPFPPFPLPFFFSSVKKIFSSFSFYALLPFRKQDISFSKYFPCSFFKYIYPFPFFFFSIKMFFFFSIILFWPRQSFVFISFGSESRILLLNYGLAKKNVDLKLSSLLPKRPSPLVLRSER